MKNWALRDLLQNQELGFSASAPQNHTKVLVQQRNWQGTSSATQQADSRIIHVSCKPELGSHSHGCAPHIQDASAPWNSREELLLQQEVDLFRAAVSFSA